MTNSSNVGGGAQGAATKDENINVMVFENAEFGPVRTLVDTNGTPLFCGKDVCDALGYAKTDKAVREHVNKVDVLKRYVYFQRKLKDGTMGVQRKMEMLFVNESGYYCLVFGSKLEAAQRFKHWGTSEVLPSIRKNGYYSMIQMKNKLIDEQTSRIHELDKMMGEQLVRLRPHGTRQERGGGREEHKAWPEEHAATVARHLHLPRGGAAANGEWSRQGRHEANAQYVGISSVHPPHGKGGWR